MVLHNKTAATRKARKAAARQRRERLAQVRPPRSAEDLARAIFAQADRKISPKPQQPPR